MTGPSKCGTSRICAHPSPPSEQTQQSTGTSKWKTKQAFTVNHTHTHLTHTHTHTHTHTSDTYIHTQYLGRKLGSSQHTMPKYGSNVLPPQSYRGVLVRYQPHNTSDHLQCGRVNRNCLRQVQKSVTVSYFLPIIQGQVGYTDLLMAFSAWVGQLFR